MPATAHNLLVCVPSQYRVGNTIKHMNYCRHRFAPHIIASGSRLMFGYRHIWRYIYASKYDVGGEGRSPKDWLDKSWTFQEEPNTAFGFEDEPVTRVPHLRPTSYWLNNSMPMFDRRLFPTASEPAMCHYSVPVGYSLEPVSLPVYTTYVPVPSDPVSLRRRSNRMVAQTNGLQELFASAPPLSQGSCRGHKNSRRSSSRLQPGVDSGTTEEFTSLPPAGKSHPPDAIRRRFMKLLVCMSVFRFVGLAVEMESKLKLCHSESPAAHCADSSDSGDSCSRASTPTSNALVLSLVVQVNALQDSNKQLCQQLQETKAELETLKHSLRQLPPEYEPGMLSDLIREIRDAARVREEVLLSRVSSMLEAAGKMNPANHLLGLKDSLVDKCPVTSQKLDGITHQFQHLQIQREKTKASINQTDETLGNHAEQLCALELENLQLRRGLQEAVARSKDKECQAQQLERLVDVLRRKISGVLVDDKPATSEQSPTESLVSTVSSSSTTHSPQVTMSGPVTDL
ncbi:hypothetical protein Cfor_00613 [Coptotermes formosanus]|uniref:Uncharacterized protein n=1 Tax=Coptotermes formosanus TaxID=36987 RepID=A0A6L2PC34_COPFO|nr:hypothetical protein Cfor_00613 [Coptotermes formosanus]